MSQPPRTPWEAGPLVTEKVEAPLPETPLPEDPTSSPVRSADEQAWREVAWGFKLQFAANVLQSVGLAQVLIFVFLQLLPDADNGRSDFQIIAGFLIFGVAMFAQFGGYLLSLAAAMYFLQAPPRPALRPRAAVFGGVVFLTLIVFALMLIRFLDFVFDELGGNSARDFHWIGSFVVSVILEAWRLILLLLFLRVCALERQAPALSRLALILIIVAPLAYLGMFVGDIVLCRMMLDHLLYLRLIIPLNLLVFIGLMLWSGVVCLAASRQLHHYPRHDQGMNA